MNKHFDGNKYCMNRGYWFRTTPPYTRLSHDVWNDCNPNNRIEYNDRQVIHHINGDSTNDRIENLQKMTLGEHVLWHRPRWRGGIKYKTLYFDYEKIEKYVYYQICQDINSLGEIKGSRFIIHDRRF